MRCLAALPVLAAAVALAAPAAAAPDCADLAPQTRMCRTTGHTAIVSSPDPAFTDPWPGWGFGTLSAPYGFGR